MSDYERTYPHGSLESSSSERLFWQEVLDLTKKVAVYFPAGFNSVTLVGYYDTVSAANTAARANAKANGALPRVKPNYHHTDVPQYAVEHNHHIDAREGLPAWMDEDPL